LNPAGTYAAALTGLQTVLVDRQTSPLEEPIPFIYLFHLLGEVKPYAFLYTAGRFEATLPEFGFVALPRGSYIRIFQENPHVSNKN
jgi:hypothetical protein